MDFSGNEYILIIVSFFTSFATAMSGVGGGVLLIAFMSQLLPGQLVVPLHGIVQLGSNFGRSLIMAGHMAGRLVMAFAMGSGLGAIVGAQMVVGLSEATLQIILSVFILVVAWLPNRIGKLKKAGTILLPGIGFVSTFASMFVGASGTFVAVLIRSFTISRQEMIATMAGMMTIQHLAKIVAFGLAGFDFAPYLGLLTAMIASGFLGTLAGRRFLEFVPETSFWRILKLLLTVLACRLLWQGVQNS